MDTKPEVLAPGAETAAPVAPAESVEAAPPPPAAADPKSQKIDAAVEAWLSQHVRNGVIAQHTPSWNHLQAALPALKAIIQQEV